MKKSEIPSQLRGVYCVVTSTPSVFTKVVKKLPIESPYWRFTSINLEGNPSEVVVSWNTPLAVGDLFKIVETKPNKAGKVYQNVVLQPKLSEFRAAFNILKKEAAGWKKFITL